MEKNMPRIVAITNRRLCYEYHPEYELFKQWKDYREPFSDMDTAEYKMCTALMIQLEKLAQRSDIEFIVLREKDLELGSYMVLANEAMKICSRFNKELVLHYYYEAASTTCGLHLPLWRLRELQMPVSPRRLGVSVHSVEEALEAQKLGATYIIAGNIYETDCKRGLPGKGLEYLKAVCDAVSVPVYAIGGIKPERFPEISRAGVAGGCMMSGLMK
jgi:thiamine-phosphate pyrophosphorylase